MSSAPSAFAPAPKQVLPKPSDALTAMIDGLRSLPKRSNFSLDMHTYGDERHGMCFGCAATLTTMTAMEKQGMTVSADQGKRADELQDKWQFFESRINQLRLGGQYGALCLLMYYDLCDVEGLMPDVSLTILTNTTWQHNLEPYEAWRDKLISLGY